jgi:pimeloyl-ACP methyl ester carboxylesterase
MPIVIIPRALLSLLSLLILAGAAYLLWSWYDGFEIRDASGYLRRVRGPDWWLYLGLILAAWSVCGRFVVALFLPAGPDEPRETRTAGRVVEAPDGSRLHVETWGLAGAPTLILTHGWGLNSTAWWYAKETLSKRFQLMTWDLPGLGRSTPPKDGKLTIDRFAQGLGAVLQSAGDGPVILVGHSIGGMTTQTFWRTASQAQKERVIGMVLIDTTHENPLRTMWLSGLWRALRWPLIEPICWLTIVLSPLAWLSAWQSYLSGSSQLAMRLTGFGRYATRGQVDFSARLSAKGSPAVQAKGNLAMFRWQATEVLPTIGVPVLILSGDRDIVTLPSASATITRAVPKGRLVAIEGAGHMGFLECSAAYDAAIAEFAEQQFGAYAPTPQLVA